MATLSEQVMECYYNRDADRLQQLLAKMERRARGWSAAWPPALLAWPNPLAGPSSDFPDTGRSERENALADGPGKG